MINFWDLCLEIDKYVFLKRLKMTMNFYTLSKFILELFGPYLSLLTLLFLFLDPEIKEL